MVLSEYTHCAIVVVVELARQYNKGGMSCKDISRFQHIPLSRVEEVANTLESLGIISFRDLYSGKTTLYLNKDPEVIMLEDIVKIFDKEPFLGIFIDDVTGEILPQSHLSKLINKERQYINKYLSNRYRAISLAKWAEYTNRERRSL